MINDVMREIAEAEQKAEEIIAAARARAKEIALGTQEEAERAKKEYALRLKEKQSEIAARADAQAQEQTAKLLKDVKLEAAELAKVNERTLAKCVEQIAERIGKA